MPFEPRSFYGPLLVPLLEHAPRNELGPGRPDLAMRDKLASLTPETIVAPRSLADRAMGLACLSGIWLRYDFLDESHRISQDLENATGSFWHGIMHRREGDFSNAKYWFRRVGDHPVFEPLRLAAAEVAAKGDREQDRSAGVAYLCKQESWDPLRFVDLCQDALREYRQVEPLCRRIQELEWELLFAHCYRQASGI